jgi:hypothetical protein
MFLLTSFRPRGAPGLSEGFETTLPPSTEELSLLIGMGGSISIAGTLTLLYLAAFGLYNAERHTLRPELQEVFTFFLRA